MNDLIRPALYDAWHAVEPVRPRDGAARRWQIVGPVCESGDFLAHDRELALAEGDLSPCARPAPTAFVMSSNYNSRPRACEVIVDGDRVHLARPRESVADLFARESIAALTRGRARCTSPNRRATRGFSVCESATIANSQRSESARILAIQQNVARIQAAGSSGFVK